MEPTASGAVWVCGGAFSMHVVTHVARWHGSNILLRPHTAVVSLHGDGYGSCCWTTAKTNGSVGAPDVVVLFSTPYLVTNSLHNTTQHQQSGTTQQSQLGEVATTYDVMLMFVMTMNPVFRELNKPVSESKNASAAGIYRCQTKGGGVVLKHLRAAACCDHGRPWRACRGHCCQDKEVWLCHSDFAWRGLLLPPGALPAQEAKRLHLDLMTTSGVAVTAGGPTASSVDGGADGDGDNGGGDAGAGAGDEDADGDGGDDAGGIDDDNVYEAGVDAIALRRILSAGQNVALPFTKSEGSVL